MLLTRHLPLLAIAGSGALLVAALAFQYVGGLAPCELCNWQRWPHLAAIILGLAYVLQGNRLFGILAAASLFAGSGIALFHVGVEQQWWAGLSACSGTDLGDMTGRQLLDMTVADTIVRCDEVAWSYLGLSMAAWNGLISLVLCKLWVLSVTSRLGHRSAE